jgi:hypothetical protein
LPHDRTHLGCADVEPYDDIVIDSHIVCCFWVTV